jgi:hypothetical protein
MADRRVAAFLLTALVIASTFGVDHERLLAFLICLLWFRPRPAEPPGEG